MGFFRFLRSRLWETVFLALASSALAFTACSAFYATQPFQVWPQALVVAGACAVFGLALECVAYTKRTALWGGIALAVVACAAVGACIAASPYELPLEDAEGNCALVAIVVVASTAAAFLLSRTKPGSVALLVGGAVLCGLVEYLYWYGHVVALCLFLAGAVGLLACSGYRRTLTSSDEGSVAFTPIALAAIALSAAALLVGAGLYFAVVAPMNPPGMQVKLVVEHMRVEEIYIMGTGSSTDDETGEGGSLFGDDEQIEGQDAETEWYDTFQDGASSLLSMEDDQRGDEGATTALVSPELMPVLVGTLALLVVIAAILLKKWLRKRRFDRMTSGENEQAVENLYLFFLSRMEKLKIARSSSASLSEFVGDSLGVLAAFEGKPVTAVAQASDAGGNADAPADAGAPANAEARANTPADAEIAESPSASDEAAQSGALTGSVSKSEGASGATAKAAADSLPAFAGLTSVYERVVYGEGKVSDDELKDFKDYYRSFYRNMRKRMGMVRYALRYFFI